MKTNTLVNRIASYNAETTPIASAKAIRSALRDVAYVLALSKKMAAEIRQGQGFKQVEAARAWAADESTVSVAV